MESGVIPTRWFAGAGSDFGPVVPTMESGYILVYEFMGEVVEGGSAVTNLKKGDRVVVPFTMSCGSYFFSQNSFFASCDNSNPNAEPTSKQMGHASAGIFG